MNFNENSSSGQQNTDPNTDVSQMTVADLNDDCLLKTFRYLNLSDLARASEVCHLFSEIAVETFRSVWKSETIRLCNDSKESKLEASIILRRFGSLLQK